MMGWYGGGMGTVGLLAMGLFWVILLGLIGWLVIRLLPAGSDQPARGTGESAVEILDRRMASGELDTQEWQARRGAFLAAQRAGKWAVRCPLVGELPADIEPLVAAIP
jgi:putative membrane protein